MSKEAAGLGGRILDTSVIDLTVDTPPPPPRIRATAVPVRGQEERQKRRLFCSVESVPYAQSVGGVTSWLQRFCYRSDTT